MSGTSCLHAGSYSHPDYRWEQPCNRAASSYVRRKRMPRGKRDAETIERHASHRQELSLGSECLERMLHERRRPPPLAFFFVRSDILAPPSEFRVEGPTPSLLSCPSPAPTPPASAPPVSDAQAAPESAVAFYRLSGTGP